VGYVTEPDRGSGIDRTPSVAGGWRLGVGGLTQKACMAPSTHFQDAAAAAGPTAQPLGHSGPGTAKGAGVLVKSRRGSGGHPPTHPPTQSQGTQKWGDGIWGIFRNFPAFGRTSKAKRGVRRDPPTKPPSHGGVIFKKEA